jgi:hypothetical protein
MYFPAIHPLYWMVYSMRSVIGRLAVMEAGQTDRLYWLRTMCRIGAPVLEALAERKLKERMPVQSSGADRADYAHLEALGRLLTGMAPWLELNGLAGEEAELQHRYRALAREAIDAATDPASPDRMNFASGHQPIVDAAFLAHAVLRAPRSLWETLEPRVRRNLVLALKETRTRKPAACNWLLFSAMIETALYRMGESDWDRMRIDYALKQHEQWYAGDGVYGDGPEFHWDYYNSFVIHPMMLDIVRTAGEQEKDWARMRPRIETRAVRHAVIQERLISPEGTFPPIGRSLAYRFGAFQLLAQIALLEMLPAGIVPAQVRGALTAVIKRVIEAPGTFDEQGWLKIGFCGDQPDIGESYISTGSLYLCAAVFLPLGLAPDRPFWQGAAPWTAVKAWSGQPFPIDHALPG